MVEKNKVLLLILCLFAVVGLIWLFSTMSASAKAEEGDVVSSNPHFIRMRDTIVEIGNGTWDKSRYKAVKNELYQLFTEKPVQLLNDKEYGSLSSLLKNGYFTVLARRTEAFCMSGAPGDPLGTTLSTELDNEFEHAFQPERRSNLKQSLDRFQSASRLNSKVDTYVMNKPYNAGMTNSLLASAKEIETDPLLRSNVRMVSIARSSNYNLTAHRELAESMQKLLEIGGMSQCDQAIDYKPINRKFYHYVRLCNDSK